MGRFVFEVPPDATSQVLDRCLHDRAYLCGIEGVPFHTEVRRDGHRLILDRRVESSARLLIPYWIDGVGYRTVATCSLRPNDDGPAGDNGAAYSLPLELARGSCMTARTQSDLWSRGGLQLDDALVETLRRGTGHFIESATHLHRQPPRRRASQKSAVASIQTLQRSVDLLSHQYAVQSIAYRSRTASPIGTMVGAAAVPPHPTTGPAWAAYQSAMNCLAVRTSWADIETDSGSLHFDRVDAAMAAAAAVGMRVIAGPIVDFRQRLMPHWLYLLENDFDQLVHATVKFVDAVVRRYRGKVTLWIAASGLNTPGPLPLSDEQAMRLTVNILQAVRRADPAAATVMSFDQPFGEYLADSQQGISPMHFADAIARSGLGLSGLGLEYRMGYTDIGTLPQSSLQIGNSIERWATLGMPLLVTLGLPGGSGLDDQAIAPSPVWNPLTNTVDEASAGTDSAAFDWDAWQLRVGGPVLRTLLAKPCVHGVLWDGWDDRVPHVHSHSGLIDAHGGDRRMLDYFRRLKSDGVI